MQTPRRKNRRLTRWFRSPQVTIRGRRYHLPLPARFPRIGLPKFRFGVPRLGNIQFANRRIKWIILGTVAVSGSVVAVGMWAAIKDVISSSFDWPAPGAAYALGSPLGTMGERLENYEESGQPSQTLQINLASGVRISTLTFRNLNMGKAGLTDCVVVQRGSGTGYLYADDIVMTSVSAPSLDWANSEIATLSVAGSVDGHTWNATINSTISDQVVVSTRGSGTFEATDSTVDRLIIQLYGDATVGTLTFDNVKCSVGGWNMDYIKASTLTQDADSQFGTGDGIDTADYILQDSLLYRVGVDSLQDTPITVR